MTGTLLKLAAAAALSLLLSACAGKELVVLLPGEDGAPTGAVFVKGGSGDGVLLDKPLTAARSGSGGATTVSIDQAEVDRSFASTLAAVPPAPISFTLYFQLGSTELVPSSQPVMEALLAEVASRPAAVEVQVTGHTDRHGSVRRNDQLALQRAKAIAALLKANGIKTDSILTVGRGEREPLVPTEDGVREEKNRRVEIIVR